MEENNKPEKENNENDDLKTRLGCTLVILGIIIYSAYCFFRDTPRETIEGMGKAIMMILGFVAGGYLIKQVSNYSSKNKTETEEEKENISKTKKVVQSLRGFLIVISIILVLCCFVTLFSSSPDLK